MANEAGGTPATHQQELEEAYAEVGRVTTQLVWLKRKSGVEPPAR